MTRFAIVTLGSAGDLHPFLAIARSLTDAGHEVHLLSQAPYRTLVEAEGVRFRAVTDARAHQRTLAHPRLWHPIDGLGVLWRHLVVPSMEPTVVALDELSGQRASTSPLVVLASPLAVGARLAKHRWPGRIRLLTGYTAPTALRETGDPLFLGHWQVPRWAPVCSRHLMWRALDHWKLEPMARPALEHWRERWSLPAYPASIFGQWLPSPDGGVTLYPAAFAPVNAAWSARGVRSGAFALFRPRHPAGLAPEVRRFVDEAKGRFAVIYTGSAAATGTGTGAGEQAAEHALRSLGLRVLHIGAFLQPEAGAHTGAGGNEPPEQVLRVGPQPWHTVLPTAALIVHHGGIGTLAEAWAAGTPQLMLPTGFDQFDNAERARRIGLGDWLPAHRRQVDALALAARRCLRDAEAGTARAPEFPQASNAAAYAALLAVLTGESQPH